MNSQYLFVILYAIGSCALVSCTAPSDRGVEVSLVFSGEEGGFIEPCGCALAQLGGLARRATALGQLRSTGQPLLLVHNGGVIVEPGWQQELKLETALAAMAEMGYAAMNLGVGEVSLGREFLQTQAMNHELPLLAANLRWEGSANCQFAFPGWVIREVSGVRIGIVGLMSIARAKEAQMYDPSLTWSDPAEVARQALGVLRSERAMPVLLFHGTLEEARGLAQQVPGYAAVVAQGGEQPLVEAQQIGETLLVTPGEKGKWLCALRLEAGKVSRKGVSRDVQSLPLSEDYAEDATVGALMALYHTMVRNMSQQLGGEVVAVSAEGGATYVGSGACQTCHRGDHAVWKGSLHAHAYETLVEKGRQHDPECVACHVTGYGEVRLADSRNGAGGFVSMDETPQLAGVGCEACHGAGSGHVVSPRAADSQGRGKACARCHTPETSPEFGYASYWAKIEHGMAVR